MTAFIIKLGAYLVSSWNTLPLPFRTLIDTLVGSDMGKAVQKGLEAVIELLTTCSISVLNQIANLLGLA
ncbi:hypothetical protein [Enterococcus sp. DIV0660C]|uniref:hypothetical protein n=1 Tax=Enterococcus sp. DIV0660C TaxID=2230880 RepID=UPI001A8EEF10|nr:hypothetical protein [Enterococcus sp. DIV0660C]MBO0431792.1 hypothetical protein [Enterococcus sp. DIV0660C]